MSGYFIPFVWADGHNPEIYFDDEATLAWGLFIGPPGTPLDAHIERFNR